MKVYFLLLNFSPSNLHLSVLIFINHTAWQNDDNLYAAANLLIAKLIFQNMIKPIVFNFKHAAKVYFGHLQNNTFIENFKCWLSKSHTVHFKTVAFV